MTNATDALRALADRVASLATDWGDMDEAERRDAIANELRALATPAGSASGEVPFAVVGGVEFDSPQALCAAHAELQSELSDYRMAANAEAREVDRRGERIAALQAEVARHKEYAADAAAAKLAAELAQRRTEAEAARLRKLLCRIRDDRSWRTNDNALWQDILAALHQRKENGRAG